MPVSVGLLLVFPGPSRPPLDEHRKKEKVTRSYTFRNENVTCHAGGDLRQNSSEGESSVPLGLDVRKPKLPGLKREELDVTCNKRKNVVEKMDVRDRIRTED